MFILINVFKKLKLVIEQVAAWLTHDSTLVKPGIVNKIF